MSKQNLENKLYYGDNLDVLIKYVKDESVDLCYIDPPFNSKRNYNQIYKNIGKDDQAQAQAFVDTWTWGQDDVDAYYAITNSNSGLYPRQCVELIIGLRKVLGESALMAYLISMTLRIVQIYRVLKPTGSFYFHCDPTASHYLKLLIDSIFCSQDGDFKNEIIWHYRKWSIKQVQFCSNHDVIFFYSKSSSKDRVFKHPLMDRAASTLKRFGNKKIVSGFTADGKRLPSSTESVDSEGVPMDDVWDIGRVPPIKQLYPTQKPEALLERIINASTNEGDLVLDAFCGCGTTVAVAQHLNRKWIGIDITYQAISVILKRLEDQYGTSILDNIELNGIPRGMNAAIALANKKDDRVRKEFEKWSILTYSNNKAIINEKKGADKGIDGIIYMLTGHDEHKKVLFSVKSGAITLSQVRDFCHVISKEDSAVMGIFITMDEPSKPMIQEALNMGNYINPLTNQSYPVLSFVTVQEILDGKRVNLPQSIEVLKSAERIKSDSNQSELELGS